jgi:hypothetical protein
MSSAETVDQYDILKRAFDTLDIKYEEWDSPVSPWEPATLNNHDSRIHKQSLDVEMSDGQIEFWFSDGKFSHIYMGD